MKELEELRAAVEAMTDGEAFVESSENGGSLWVTVTNDSINGKTGEPIKWRIATCFLSTKINAYANVKALAALKNAALPLIAVAQAAVDTQEYYGLLGEKPLPLALRQALSALAEALRPQGGK